MFAAALALAGCGPNATGLGVNLVPAEQVAQMSLQAWQEIRQKEAASTNAGYQQRAQTVARRVLRGAELDPAPWEVVVFAGDQVNAFALPGGKIGVYEGMMRLADTDAELAAVIGHEIAHNTEEHARERVNSEAATQLGVQLAGAALGAGESQALAALLGAGAQYGIVMPYGRNQELEADRLGLMYMARAGYDPRAALTFWRKMAQLERSAPPAFLSTHPNPEQRVTQLDERMPAALQVYQRAGR